MSKAKNIFRFKLNFQHYKEVLATCYDRTKRLVDVSGPSSVSLSKLCSQVLLLIGLCTIHRT